MNIVSEHSLAPYHTFGIDRQAAHIVIAESVEDLRTIWQCSEYQALPKLMLGHGSNLLFCDDYQGVVVINRIKGIEVTESESDFLLHVGGGENWHDLVKWTVDQNMPGLENLALIPGCVGSSPIQNIGAYGVELKDVCDYVDVLNIQTGESLRLSADECQFGYRESIFKHQLSADHIITSVGLRLSKQWQPKVHYGPLAQLAISELTPPLIFDTICQIRREKLPDPQLCGNAGSFFKNPVVDSFTVHELKKQYPEMPSYEAGNGSFKLAAGWLIDQCNLKGFSIGGAQVHPLQALVLTNTGNATSNDIIQLAQHIVDTVKEKFDVALQHEVRFMGATQETSLAECQHHE